MLHPHWFIKNTNHQNIARMMLLLQHTNVILIHSAGITSKLLICQLSKMKADTTDVQHIYPQIISIKYKCCH